MHNGTNGVFGSTYSTSSSHSYSSSSSSSEEVSYREPQPVASSSNQFFSQPRPVQSVEVEKSHRRCAPTCIIS